MSMKCGKCMWFKDNRCHYNPPAFDFFNKFGGAYALRPTVGNSDIACHKFKASSEDISDKTCMDCRFAVCVVAQTTLSNQWECHFSEHPVMSIKKTCLRMHAQTL